ncbi:thiamine diphosphokinase [Brucepastera parasyntrophica]|uniref:thiamine diphosphokinase n=1 Tax=Brucepastera parasyntrophica TaxID=2880008 RepID=UPI00210E8AE6|nr:thiamine diphosphokinase [Brucepastera parasyntrophica]ULQ58938.1 thiamine diphosphokinase [Brucepastera parasyntrophica]
MEKKPEAAYCVILGAGDIADYEGAGARINPKSFIICADGGLRHCKKLKVHPDLLIGDFDSSEITELPKNTEHIILSPDKNYTDTAYAAEEARNRGYTDIFFAGMTGGRLDHTLANLQILGSCAVHGQNVMLSDGITDVYAAAAGSKKTQ